MTGLRVNDLIPTPLLSDIPHFSFVFPFLFGFLSLDKYVCVLGWISLSTLHA